MNQPKNFFLQIGIIVTLYASIVSFINFLFGIINNLLPNPDTYYDYTNSSIRISVSVLIVMFPVFIFLSRLYRKSVMTEPEIKESKLRKWLIYLTLFLAGLTIAIDVVVLVNSFLGGENFTLSFILKVLSVFVVAFSVFYFYLNDIKGKWDQNQKKVKNVATITSIIVVLSVIFGIITIGSPSKQRDFANDRQRISDLSMLQFNLTDFYQDKASLPKSLEELKDPLKSIFIPKDPETKEDYTYEVMGPLSFKLCATFKTDSEEHKTKNTEGVYSVYPVSLGEESFEHTVGENCFERTIDKDRFPIRQK